MRFNTGLLHGKTSGGYSEREILPPISQVSAFKYDSMEELERVFAHKSMGYAYTRIGNPTLTAFEQRMNWRAVRGQLPQAAVWQPLPRRSLRFVRAEMRS